MALLTTDTSIPSGLMPRAEHVLSDVRIESHDRARLTARPPLGVYNLAFREAVDAVSRTVQLVSPLYGYARERAADELEPGGPILTATLDALHKLVAYYDQLEGILRRFFDANDKKGADKAVKNLDKRLKRHRDVVGASVNRVKHANCRLNPIAYFDPAVHPGWFVEGYSQGAVAPDPAIHPEVLSFSFARTLRLWTVGIIEGSDGLAEAICARIPLDAATVRISGRSEPVYLDLVRSVARLPFIFFPDESKLEVPYLYYGEDKKEMWLKFGLGDGSAKPKFARKEAALYQAMTADGVSKSFKMAHRG